MVISSEISKVRRPLIIYAILCCLIPLYGGNESQAVVEFAPNQKVPPEKKKVDTRHATIQQGIMLFVSPPQL